MKTKLLITFLSLLFVNSIIAQNYIIDPGHSTVQIQVERFGVVDVSGRFKDVSGTISYDANDITKTNANAVIKVDSYDANNIGEEAGEKQCFLDVVSYPEISFKGLTTIVKDGKNYLKGNLTIHGVTKEIELPFTIKGPLLDLPTRKQSIAFNASITINRQDYAIAFDRKLPNGTSLVSDNVKITLIVLALAE